MKYNVKHIDVPGFRLIKQIELPDDVVPFKVDYVVETPSNSVTIYDSFRELDELLFNKEYKVIEPDTIIIPKNNSLLQYKVSIRFYYLEKL